MIKNTGEGFHPPLSLYTTVGVWICVYVRGLTLLNWFELFVSVICFKDEGKNWKGIIKIMIMMIIIVINITIITMQFSFAKLQFAG